MDRAEPVFNKLLVRQWHRRNYHDHRQRLDSIQVCGEAKRSADSRRALELHKRHLLSSEKRQRDLARRAAENQQMKGRLQSKRSLYSVQKWQQQEVQRQKFLEFARYYPYRTRTPGLDQSTTEAEAVKSAESLRAVARNSVVQQQEHRQRNLFQNLSQCTLPSVMKKSSFSASPHS